MAECGSRTLVVALFVLDYDGFGGGEGARYKEYIAVGERKRSRKRKLILIFEIVFQACTVMLTELSLCF